MTQLFRLTCVGLFLAAGAMSASAQIPDPPTLSELGLEYVSQSGFFQVTLSGQLDLEGIHVTSDLGTPPADLDECQTCHVDVGRQLEQGRGSFDIPRLRLFADIFLGDHVYTMVEVRGNRGRESLGGRFRTRTEQVFVRFTDTLGRIALQLGRFSSPFGSYAMRHRTVVDPFITAPLMYEYRTVMNRWRAPPNAVGFLNWQDRPFDADLPGAPPIWEVPYQWGAMLTGSLGPVDLRFAAMNSAPSSHPNAWRLDWDRFRRPSWVVGARWKPLPSLEVGASYDQGPWMESPNNGTLGPQPEPPPGTPAPDWSDRDQEVIAVDVAFARGPYMLRAEGILDRWEVPNVGGRPTEIGLDLEAQRDLLPGLSAALRFGYLDFRPVDDGLGVSSPYPGGRDWDYDVYRYEGSLAYRLSRNLGLLLSGYRQVQSGPGDADGTFAGLRLWWMF